MATARPSSPLRPAKAWAQLASPRLVLKRLLRHPLALDIGAALVGCYLRFALMTTRWRLLGGEHMAPYAAGVPVIVAFWHERIPLMPMLWVMARRTAEGRQVRNRAHVLVSQHRDGRLIGLVVRWFGLDVVHGSSSRGGGSGLRQLRGILAAGDHVAITPDGPRGPARRAAPGVAKLAALSGASILPCAAQTSRRRVLRRSWDNMTLPRPFGRGVVVCEPPITVDRADWEAALPRIEAAITAAARRADQIVDT